MTTYKIMTETDDGLELLAYGLSYHDAMQEMTSARREFGGEYWMEPEKRENPLIGIPAITPGMGVYPAAKP